MVQKIKWMWPVLIGLFLLPVNLHAVEIGEQIPSFSLTTLDGKAMASENIVGKQALFLVFWATWCPLCKDEIPHINEMAAEFTPKGMLFLGVNVGVNDSEKKIRRYAEKYNMQYPLYFDKGSELTKQFTVKGTPTVIIVDKSGIVRYRDFVAPKDLGTHFDMLNK